MRTAVRSDPIFKTELTGAGRSMSRSWLLNPSCRDWRTRWTRRISLGWEWLLDDLRGAPHDSSRPEEIVLDHRQRPTTSIAWPAGSSASYHGYYRQLHVIIPLYMLSRWRDGRSGMCATVAARSNHRGRPRDAVEELKRIVGPDSPEFWDPEVSDRMRADSWLLRRRTVLVPLSVKTITCIT